MKSKAVWHLKNDAEKQEQGPGNFRCVTDLKASAQGSVIGKMHHQILNYEDG